MVRCTCPNVQNQRVPPLLLGSRLPAPHPAVPRPQPASRGASAQLGRCRIVQHMQQGRRTVTTLPRRWLQSLLYRCHPPASHKARHRLLFLTPPHWWVPRSPAHGRNWGCKLFRFVLFFLRYFPLRWNPSQRGGPGLCACGGAALPVCRGRVPGMSPGCCQLMLPVRFSCRDPQPRSRTWGFWTCPRTPWQVPFPTAGAGRGPSPACNSCSWRETSELLRCGCTRTEGVEGRDP